MLRNKKICVVLKEDARTMAEDEYDRLVNGTVLNMDSNGVLLEIDRVLKFYIPWNSIAFITYTDKVKKCKLLVGSDISGKYTRYFR